MAMSRLKDIRPIMVGDNGQLVEWSISAYELYNNDKLCSKEFFSPVELPY